MASAPADDCDLPARLERATTLWDAACALLRCWRVALPAEPARHATGDRWTAWAESVERVQQHFRGPRAPDDFGADDRTLLRQVTLDGQLPDAVDAAAWGLSNAASHTFAPAWRDQLGVERRTLAAGDLYPVADAPWELSGMALASRPASLTPPRADELPTIRAHDGASFDVAVDFRFARTLEAVAVTLDRVAAVHPNDGMSELDFPCRGGQVFPVGPADPREQRRRLARLIPEALRTGAAVAVLPELSVPAEALSELHDLMRDVEEPQLLIAGSHHTVVDGERENVAVGLVAGHDERMEQVKSTPFSDELRLRAPMKEGIRHRARPSITVHEADRFRLAIAICKDALDDRVRGALDRMGVNLLLVPALSEKTAPFCIAAASRVGSAQAVSVVVNGPLRDEDGAPIQPAVVIGQPVEGRPDVGVRVHDAAPVLTVVPVPAEPGT